MPLESAEQERPAHVPASRVVDFDLFNPPGLEHGVQEAWLALHRRNPAALLWTPHYGGHWIVNDGGLVQRFYADFEHFSSTTTQVPQARNIGNNAIPASLDPPEQTPYRAIINAALSATVVKGMEERMAAKAVALVEGLAPRGRCEFMNDFALPLPLQLFMDYAGLPYADIPRLRSLIEQKIRPSGEGTAGEAQEALASYLDPYLQARRGGGGTDLLSRMVNGRKGGELLSHDEARRICSQFLVAGLDTVAATLGFFFLHLARNAALRARIAADEALIGPAVEELLRRFPLVSRVRRVTADYPCDGVTMRADDMIVIPTSLHGLDERYFPEPEQVRLDRPPQVNSTFGHGPHRCPGSTLARIELRVALREWLRRIPDFRVADETRVELKAGFVATVAHLPLAWD